MPNLPGAPLWFWIPITFLAGLWATWMALQATRYVSAKEWITEEQLEKDFPDYLPAEKSPFPEVRICQRGRWRYYLLEEERMHGKRYFIFTPVSQQPISAVKIYLVSGVSFFGACVIVSCAYMVWESFE
jgi:hypothetical protein